ncbi:hypothetical protein SAMN04487848_2053 [Microbacterium sp. ru370.1]|uniref:hypothetical protein n=1 Tax=unclassified Microbacterium TaxID=2609290 RepID=UPI0008837420|nr:MULTISPECIES: hypothetical protein [unclassified Microbacterium]SDO77616.1 hypothetical protein SAMN04487848_2053 [Microbacterium sp. ru370.1]SIT88910.1 hypothetical protein SAMN05880579_2048 [Microbacterium sp. RU1D]
MADIATVAFFPAGKVAFEADDYTSAVDSCTLTPTTPVTPVTLVSGETVHVAGVPVWALALSNLQDLTTAKSLSLQLIAWAGQVKTVKYTPNNGGKSFTVKVVIVPGMIGGAGGALAKSTVTLQCNGQPVIDAAAA